MNYKVIKTIAAASALLLTLGACQEKPETLPPSITADESLNITGDAGSHSLTFTIENYVQEVAAEASPMQSGSPSTMSYREQKPL